MLLTSIRALGYPHFVMGVSVPRRDLNREGWILVLAVFVCASCGGRSGIIDRTIENGIEVVHNHLVPYRVRGEPAELILQEEFRIDTERPDLAAAGLADIMSFDVDTRGFIYIVQHPRKAEFLLFQFDERGGLLKRFGRKGQGPGELQFPTLFRVNSRNELWVWDGGARRLLVFGPSAELISETIQTTLGNGGLPLENGSFLHWEFLERADGKVERILVTLLSPEFAGKKTLVEFAVPEVETSSGRVNVYQPRILFAATQDHVFLGYPGPKYEILVFDLAGTLLRKIRKEYTPVALRKDDRNGIFDRIPKRIPFRDQIGFPSQRPAFQDLFADEAGRLFVMTTEKDVETSQNICDIYNPDGIFIGRRAIGYFDILRQYWEGLRLDVVAKSGHIFMLREKENGFKEMIVCKAIWR